MPRPIKRVGHAPDADDFQSSRRVARQAGCSENTILRMAMAGQIRARNTTVNISLFSLSDVMRELNRRTEFAANTGDDRAATAK